MEKKLVVGILAKVAPEALLKVEFLTYFLYSTDIIYSTISFTIGLVGSILLIYSIRNGGKFFRRSQGCYIAGLIIVILCGGWISWILLFISMFIPDVIVMNTAREVRQEERQEQKDLDTKKKQIEDLKRLRDAGIITEEEYKQKLYEIL